MAKATIKTLDGKETIFEDLEMEIQQKEGERLHQNTKVNPYHGHFKYSQYPNLKVGKYLMEYQNKTYKLSIYRIEIHEQVAYFETLHYGE